MSINKDKNVSLQITFPKEDAHQLGVLQYAFEKNGLKVNKSDILLRAFRDYVRILVMSSAKPQKAKIKKENKESKKDDK